MVPQPEHVIFCELKQYRARITAEMAAAQDEWFTSENAHAFGFTLGKLFANAKLACQEGQLSMHDCQRFKEQCAALVNHVKTAHLSFCPYAILYYSD